MLGRYHEVRAAVSSIELSSHADQGALVGWATTATTNPATVFVNHGEAAESAALATALDEHAGLMAVCPDPVSASGWMPEATDDVPVAPVSTYGPGERMYRLTRWDTMGEDERRRDARAVGWFRRVQLRARRNGRRSVVAEHVGAGLVVGLAEAG